VLGEGRMNQEERGRDWDADGDVGDVLDRREYGEETIAGFQLD
jgi:hypothetical protein